MKSICVLPLFLILIKNVISERGLSFTNYTMDFFQNLKTKSCKDISDCPDYSNGCYIPQKIGYGYCNMYMFCHERGDCLKLSMGEFEYEYYYRWPYYKTESYDVQEITMNSCNLNIQRKIYNKNGDSSVFKLGSIRDESGNENDNWGIFEDCKYQSCFDSGCFSGKCNIKEYLCEVNDNSPAYVCTLDRNEIGNYYSVKCLLMNQEPCSYNEQCLSGICDSQVEICVTKDSKLSFGEKIIQFFKRFWYYILGSFILCLIIIGIVFRIIIKKRKSNEIVLAKMDY